VLTWVLCSHENWCQVDGTTVFLEMFADTIFRVFHNVGIFAKTNFRGFVLTANFANIKSLRPKLQFLEATFLMHDIACWVLLILFFSKALCYSILFHLLSSNTDGCSVNTFTYFLTFFNMWLSKTLAFN
jgi:hypothetical protein